MACQSSPVWLRKTLKGYGRCTPWHGVSAATTGRSVRRCGHRCRQNWHAWDRATTEVIQGWLAEHHVPVLVFDPVMIATSGDRLLAKDAETAVRSFAASLNNYADHAVITPNIPELAILCGQSPANSFEEAVSQAKHGRTSTASM